VPPFSILSGENGFAVSVPNFDKDSRRRAARILWQAHVDGVPYASTHDFDQLIKAGQEMTWYRYSVADETLWGERWGEDGDLRERPMLVLWFVDDDIPGRYSWE
jgi:hypothetical protein